MNKQDWLELQTLLPNLYLEVVDNFVVAKNDLYTFIVDAGGSSPRDVALSIAHGLGEKMFMVKR